MVEDTALRFRIVHDLFRMNYGNSRVIPRIDIQKAFPPTGDHDRSDEGFFRAMALASGGNRPEESYTTEERLRNDLDESFRWDVVPMSGDYAFHRLVSHCPKCKGRGFVESWRDVPALVDFDAKIEDMTAITIDRVQCEHSP